MQREEIGNHLVIDPEVCHGQMTFKGTRVPVDTVLAFVAKGYTLDQILKSWPELTEVAVEEAMVLASQALQAYYTTARSVATPVAP